MNTAAQFKALTRENARLRGDLQTIASRISHDLRTPLGGIITPGEFLKEVLEEKDPSLVALTNSLLDSAEEISKLISRISFVARASANPISKKTVAMGKIVSEVLQRLERLILKNQATVKQPESWPEIPGVSEWLETIWWNLLANALQHTGSGTCIEMGWRREDGQIRFWIQDNGPGVAQENSKLFQPFNSLHETNSARGLGLSIVQRLVELQEGECGYEVQTSTGACFFFTLPLEKTPAPVTNIPAIKE